MTKTSRKRTGGRRAAKKGRDPSTDRTTWALSDARAEEFAADVARPEAPVVTPTEPTGPVEPTEPADTAAPADPAGPPDDVDLTEPADPAAAFDQLYALAARPLTRQTLLLTGARGIAEWAVTRAFHTAWEHWPEVAVDPDPAGWVRAAAHEHALSPWHRLRPGHRRPDAHVGPPGDRVVLDALLSLPGVYRRALLLHDGTGLGIAETAAETEASIPATVGRVSHAREALAALLPEVRDAALREVRGAAPEERGKVIRALLDRVAAAQPVRTVPARDVRAGSEQATRRRTVAAYGLVGVVVAASAFSIATTEQGDLLPRTPLSYVQELSAS